MGLGGLISRLCVHFFLGFASRGRPISFPRSFIPVHDRLTDLLRNTADSWDIINMKIQFGDWSRNSTIVILTNCSLYLAQDLVVGNCFPTLIVRNDLRLLINFLRKKICNTSFIILLKPQSLKLAQQFESKNTKGTFLHKTASYKCLNRTEVHPAG